MRTLVEWFVGFALIAGARPALADPMRAGGSISDPAVWSHRTYAGESDVLAWGIVETQGLRVCGASAGADALINAGAGSDCQTPTAQASAASEKADGGGVSEDIKLAMLVVLVLGTVWKYFTSPAYYQLLGEIFGPLDQY